MSTYSKAYQEVVAGRVREDEQIGFYGENKVALPTRTTAFTPVGAKKQPTLEKDNLNHPGIGKAGTESEEIAAYNENPYNIS